MPRLLLKRALEFVLGIALLAGCQAQNAASNH
jgi:hypothetical protein